MIRHDNEDGFTIFLLILMSITLFLVSISTMDNETDIEKLKQENSELVERIEGIEEQQEIEGVTE